MRMINQFKTYLYRKKPMLHFAALFFLSNTFLLWIIGIRYLAVILNPRALTAVGFYECNMLGKILVSMFILFTYLSHLALVAFIPAICIVIPLILLINQRFLILSCAILAASVTAIIIILDNVVYSMYHFHINIFLLRIFLLDHFDLVNFFDLSKREVMIISCIILAILTFETFLAIYSMARVNAKKVKLPVVKMISCFICFILLSYMMVLMSTAKDYRIFIQITTNLPLYNDFLTSIIPEKNSSALIKFYGETRFVQPLFTAPKLQYPLHPLHCQRQAKPYNILMIGLDTWRFDALTQEVTPNIYAFAKHAWDFQNHFSGGNCTYAGLFSLFYSLPSSYWSSILHQNTPALFIQELLKQNYQTAILFSSDITYPPMNKTVFSTVPNLRITEAPGETILDQDKFITNEFKTFLRNRETEKPFFAFLFYNSLHGYCASDNLPTVFPVTKNGCQRMTLGMQNNANDLLNRYKNAAHFVDHEVADLLQTIKNDGLSNDTIIIITGDHGEEFNDTHNDYWGHTGNFTRYQVQTPFIMYWPGQSPAVFTHQTTHYDVVPYLMEHVLGCENLKADYSVGKDLFDKAPKPFIFVGSYRNIGLIQHDKSTILSTSGNIRMADSNANELDTEVDQNILAEALADMRRFYSGL